MRCIFPLIGVFVAAAACGSSSTAPSGTVNTTTPTGTVNTFHAEVTDAAGDAVASAAVPTPPYLTHGTLDV